MIAARVSPGSELIPRYAPVFILFMVYFGFGDGLGYYLRDEYGLASPHIMMLPFLLPLLLYGCFRHAPQALAPASTDIFLFGIAAAVWAIVQLAVRDGIYILGYGQLVFFVICMLLTRRLFESADRGLVERIAGAALFIHYLQCVLIIVAVAAWHAFGINLNPLDFLEQGEVQAVYGFRASGLAREPAWAAIALAATYTTIHYLMPGRRPMALLAFVVASILANSGTAFVIGIVFASTFFLEKRSAALWVAAAIIASMAAGALVYSQYDRILLILGGSDGSTNMRLASAGVAWQVVVDSFPFGVGYGNFRLFGIYGAEFDNFIDAEQISYYKSDILLLNLVSELGAAGAALVWLLYRLFRVRGHLLPTFIFLVLMVLFGTIVVPPILLVVAVCGLLQARADAEAASASHSRAAFGPEPVEG
jgi:hypothetical protein